MVIMIIMNISPIVQISSKELRWVKHSYLMYLHRIIRLDLCHFQSGPEVFHWISFVCLLLLYKHRINLQLKWIKMKMTDWFSSPQNLSWNKCVHVYNVLLPSPFFFSRAFQIQDEHTHNINKWKWKWKWVIQLKTQTKMRKQKYLRAKVKRRSFSLELRRSESFRVEYKTERENEINIIWTTAVLILSWRKEERKMQRIEHLDWSQNKIV